MAGSTIADLRRWGHCHCFGYTYVIRRDDGLYKIGMTATLRERLAAISQGLVGPVAVVLVTPSRDALGLERKLQAAHRPQRVQGDWFRLTEDHIEGIATMCDEEPPPEHGGRCAQEMPTPISGEVVDQAFTGNGEWLTPSQAALRLGMSERTLWRRIDAGKLQRRVVGGRAQVYVPVAGTVPATEERQGDSPEPLEIVPVTPDNSMMVAVIEELKASRLADSDTITRLSTRLTELERENAALEERLRPWQYRLRRWWRGDSH